MQNRKGVRNKSGGAKTKRKLPVILAVILVLVLGIFSGPVSNLLGEKQTEDLMNQLESYISEEIDGTENTAEESTNTTTESIVITEPEGTLEMYMIDVGQADSILFIQEDEVMLIDAGTRGAGDDVVRTLKELEIEEIDILIGTHPHEDHMGGMKKVLENFEIETFYFPRRTDVTTKYYIEILECVVENKIPCGTAEAGDIVEFGEAQIQFITSSAPKEEKDLNNCSIVIRVSFGEIDFFMGGDIEKEVEAEILASGMEIECEVYKASHHGSKTSNTEEFINAVNPEYIYISCGLYNKHDHPNEPIIRLFEKLQIPVYRTDEVGTIRVVTDGKTIQTDKQPGSYISGEEKNEQK